jgi:ketosteroid isomerase-like protein
VDLIRRGYDALLRRDDAKLMAVFTEDVELETLVQGSYRGQAGIGAWIEDMDRAWNDWTVVIEGMREYGDRVVVDALLTGRSAYNDADLSQRFWIVWTLRNGKAARGLHFADEDQAVAFARSPGADGD